VSANKADVSEQPVETPSYGWLRGMACVASAMLAAAVALTVLDLLFLGVVAKSYYDEALGPLRSPQVYWPAALAFYGFYVSAVVWVAVLHASGVWNAAVRGGALGLFAYGVYELTNWAVIANWPGRLVPIDVVWGMVLTGTVAASSYSASAIFRPAGATDWMRAFDMVLLLAVASWLTAPLWLAGCFFVDAVLGPRWKWARTRAVAFFMLYLGCESWGIASAATIWLITLGGRIVSRERYLEYNAILQRWWSEALMKGTFRIFSMRFEVEGQEVAKAAPFLLLVRHVSTADTVLAANIVANRHSVLIKYVIKRELLWDPCLDIVGRRLPNVFIDRSGTDSQVAINAVTRLGQEVDERSAVLIYPEGTRFSQARRARFIEHLRKSGQEDLVRIAESMRHVLPPRTRGVLAILDVAPDIDIVVLAHVGFEGARSFSTFWGGDLVGRTVRAKLWRVSASEIPNVDRERWLFERWAEVDAWVTSASI
jgi:uncharacterized membrane protein/1-acyl-sn-glycerol-3-phosphate acyltransferase